MLSRASLDAFLLRIVFFSFYVFSSFSRFDLYLFYLGFGDTLCLDSLVIYGPWIYILLYFVTLRQLKGTSAQGDFISRATYGVSVHWDLWRQCTLGNDCWCWPLLNVKGFSQVCQQVVSQSASTILSCFVLTCSTAK